MELNIDNTILFYLMLLLIIIGAILTAVGIIENTVPTISCGIAILSIEVVGLVCLYIHQTKLEILSALSEEQDKKE